MPRRARGGGTPPPEGAGHGGGAGGGGAGSGAEIAHLFGTVGLDAGPFLSAIADIEGATADVAARQSQYVRAIQSAWQNSDNQGLNRYLQQVEQAVSSGTSLRQAFANVNQTVTQTQAALGRIGEALKSVNTAGAAPGSAGILRAAQGLLSGGADLRTTVDALRQMRFSAAEISAALGPVISQTQQAAKAEGAVTAAIRDQLGVRRQRTQQVSAEQRAMEQERQAQQRADPREITRRIRAIGRATAGERLEQYDQAGAYSRSAGTFIPPEAVRRIEAAKRVTVFGESTPVTPANINAMRSYALLEAQLIEQQKRLQQEVIGTAQAFAKQQAAYQDLTEKTRNPPDFAAAIARDRAAAVESARGRYVPSQAPVQPWADQSFPEEPPGTFAPPVPAGNQAQRRGAGGRAGAATTARRRAGYQEPAVGSAPSTEPSAPEPTPAAPALPKPTPVRTRRPRAPKATEPPAPEVIEPATAEAATGRTISEVQGEIRALQFEIRTRSAELTKARTEGGMSKEEREAAASSLTRDKFRLGRLQDELKSLQPRAAGGPVDPKQSYIVGEHGPEVFRPRVPGDIEPARGGRAAGSQLDLLRQIWANPANRPAFRKPLRVTPVYRGEPRNEQLLDPAAYERRVKLAKELGLENVPESVLRGFGLTHRAEGGRVGRISDAEIIAGNAAREAMAADYSGPGRQASSTLFQYQASAWINAHLRGQKLGRRRHNQRRDQLSLDLGGGPIGTPERYTELLDQAIGGFAPLSQAARVHRGEIGVRPELAGLSPDQMIGKVLSDPGYLSTAISRQQAKAFTQGGELGQRAGTPVRWAIDLPVGQRGAFAFAGGGRELSDAEYLLARGSQLQIVNARRSRGGGLAIHAKAMAEGGPVEPERRTSVRYSVLAGLRGAARTAALKRIQGFSAAGGKEGLTPGEARFEFEEFIKAKDRAGQLRHAGLGIQHLAQAGGVAAMYGLVPGEALPEYARGLIDFIQRQGKTLASGRLTPSQTAAGYLVTLASQRDAARAAASVGRASAWTGGLPESVISQQRGRRVVRPEDALAYWLGTEPGKNVLHAVSVGDIPTAQRGLEHFQKTSGFNQIRLNEAFKEPGKDAYSLRNIHEATRAINAAGAAAKHTELEAELNRFKGVGVGKTGFLGQWLGYGRQPTLDTNAQQTWLGSTRMGQVGQRMLANTRLPTGRQLRELIRQRQLEMRQLGFFPEVPEDVYPAAAHHVLFDARIQAQSTHHPITHLLESLGPQPRKAGGPVGEGSYIVGERGPELFVPDKSGTIIPSEETQRLVKKYKQRGGGQARVAGGTVFPGPTPYPGYRPGAPESDPRNPTLNVPGTGDVPITSPAEARLAEQAAEANGRLNAVVRQRATFYEEVARKAQQAATAEIAVVEDAARRAERSQPAYLAAENARVAAEIRTRVAQPPQIDVGGETRDVTGTNRGLLREQYAQRYAGQAQVARRNAQEQQLFDENARAFERAQRSTPTGIGEQIKHYQALTAERAARPRARRIGEDVFDETPANKAQLDEAEKAQRAAQAAGRPKPGFLRGLAYGAVGLTPPEIQEYNQAQGIRGGGGGAFGGIFRGPSAELIRIGAGLIGLPLGINVAAGAARLLHKALSDAADASIQLQRSSVGLRASFGDLAPSASKFADAMGQARGFLDADVRGALALSHNMLSSFQATQNQENSLVNSAAILARITPGAQVGEVGQQLTQLALAGGRADQLGINVTPQALAARGINVAALTPQAALSARTAEIQRQAEERQARIFNLAPENPERQALAIDQAAARRDRAIAAASQGPGAFAQNTGRLFNTAISQILEVFPGIKGASDDAAKAIKTQAEANKELGDSAGLATGNINSVANALTAIQAARLQPGGAVERTRAVLAEGESAAEVAPVFANAPQILTNEQARRGALLEAEQEVVRRRALETATVATRGEDPRGRLVNEIAQAQTAAAGAQGQELTNARALVLALQEQLALLDREVQSHEVLRRVTEARGVIGLQQGRAQAALEQIGFTQRERQLSVANLMAANRARVLAYEDQIAAITLKQQVNQDKITIQSRNRLDLERNILQTQLDGLSAQEKVQDLTYRTQLDQAKLNAVGARLVRGTATGQDVGSINPLIQDAINAQLDTAEALPAALEAQQANVVAQRPQTRDELNRQLQAGGLLDLEAQRRAYEDQLIPVTELRDQTQELVNHQQRLLDIAKELDQPSQTMAERALLLAERNKAAADEAERFATALHLGIDYYGDLNKLAQDLLAKIPTGAGNTAPGSAAARVANGLGAGGIGPDRGTPPPGPGGAPPPEGGPGTPVTGKQVIARTQRTDPDGKVWEDIKYADGTQDTVAVGPVVGAVAPVAAAAAGMTPPPGTAGQPTEVPPAIPDLTREEWEGVIALAGLGSITGYELVRRIGWPAIKALLAKVRGGAAGGATPTAAEPSVSGAGRPGPVLEPVPAEVPVVEPPPAPPGEAVAPEVRVTPAVEGPPEVVPRPIVVEPVAEPVPIEAAAAPAERESLLDYVRRTRTTPRPLRPIQPAPEPAVVPEPAAVPVAEPAAPLVEAPAPRVTPELAVPTEPVPAVEGTSIGGRIAGALGPALNVIGKATVVLGAAQQIESEFGVLGAAGAVVQGKPIPPAPHAISREIAHTFWDVPTAGGQGTPEEEAQLAAERAAAQAQAAEAPPPPPVPPVVSQAIDDAQTKAAQDQTAAAATNVDSAATAADAAKNQSAASDTQTAASANQTTAATSQVAAADNQDRASAQQQAASTDQATAATTQTAAAVAQTTNAATDADSATKWQASVLDFITAVNTFDTAVKNLPTAATRGDAGTAAGGNDEVEQFIRQAATARNIDPDIALRVARAEGGTDPGRWARPGDQGSSFGPYQLHVGGIAPAGSGNEGRGQGDAFREATGLNPADVRTWKQQIEFALNRAAVAGWSEWHAWTGDPRAGTAGARPVALTRPEDMQQAASVGGGRGLPGPGDLTIAQTQAGLKAAGFDANAAADLVAYACGAIAVAGIASAAGDRQGTKHWIDLAKSDYGLKPGIPGDPNSGGMTAAQMDAELASVGINVKENLSREQLGGALQKGKLVSIDSGPHHFLADQINREGAIHVGQSFKAYAGGKEWMTLPEIEALVGTVRGGQTFQNEQGQEIFAPGRGGTPIAPPRAMPAPGEVTPLAGAQAIPTFSNSINVDLSGATINSMTDIDRIARQAADEASGQTYLKVRSQLISVFQTAQVGVAPTLSGVEQ